MNYKYLNNIYNSCKEVYIDIYNEIKERVFTDNVTPITNYLKQHNSIKNNENIDKDWCIVNSINKRKCIVCEQYYNADKVYGICCSEYCKNIYLDNDMKIEKDGLLMVSCPICNTKYKIHRSEIKSVSQNCNCKEKKVRWNI